MQFLFNADPNTLLFPGLPPTLLAYRIHRNQ